MTKLRTNQTRLLIVLCMAASVGAASFGVLRSQEPDPKVKGKFNAVMAAAKLTDAEAQKAAVDFTERYFSAPFIVTEDDALYKLDSVSVHVFLADVVKEIISEDRVRNKFELILRKQGIKIDKKAPATLELNIQGIWGKDHVVFAFTPTVRLSECVVVGRNGDFRRVFATLWDRSHNGIATYQLVESAILKSVEVKAEEFANTYLSAQERSSPSGLSDFDPAAKVVSGEDEP